MSNSVFTDQLIFSIIIFVVFFTAKMEVNAIKISELLSSYSALFFYWVICKTYLMVKIFGKIALKIN